MHERTIGKKDITNGTCKDYHQSDLQFLPQLVVTCLMSIHACSLSKVVKNKEERKKEDGEKRASK